MMVYGEDFQGRSTIPGADVHLRGDDLVEVQVTDSEGRFRFDVPIGTYSLNVQMPGFYETTLKDVKVEKQPLNELVVVLQPRLSFQLELPVVGPEIVPAPELSLGVTLESPVNKGDSVRLRVTVKNRGSEPVLVPSKIWTGGEGDLLMNLTLSTAPDAGPYRAHFNGWYGCSPTDPECSIEPGESVEILISVYQEEVELSGREPVLYTVPGVFQGSAHISFVLERRHEGQRGRRTKGVAVEFKFHIDFW